MSSGRPMSISTCAEPFAVDGTKRVDFINELPFEIAMEYIVPMIIHHNNRAVNLLSRQNYFAVCTAWSKTIASCDKNIHFSIHSNNAFLKADWMRVKAVAPYIKTLTVTVSNEKAIFNLVQYARFSSLTNLTMTVEQFQAQWIKLLQSMSSLHCLHILSNVKGATFQLFEMLHQCPQLIQLKVTFDSACMLTFASDNNPVHPTLRHLEVFNARWCSDFFPRLLQYFPDLHVLRLATPTTNYEGLSMIPHCCAKLQHLLLGETKDVPDTEIALPDDGDLKGIRSLSIQSSAFHGDFIGWLLNQYGTTVELVDVLTSASFISSIRTLCNAPVVLDRLRYLRYIRDFRFAGVHFIQWILLHAPNLECVDVIGGGVPGIILRALMDRPIKMICLEWSMYASDRDGFEFLQHHAQLKDNSPLQHRRCTIYIPFTVNACWLYLIPELLQLHTLEISLRYVHDEGALTNFLSLVARGCVNLERVTFTFSVYSCPGAWILPLSQHPRLQSLVIVSGRIADDMFPIFEQFRHLESLHLKLKACDWKAIAQLKSKMPCLACTIQKPHH